MTLLYREPGIDDVVVSCRVCGCTEERACVDPRSTFGTCWWVEEDLCSACADEAAARVAPTTVLVAPMLEPLRTRIGPGARRRRDRKIARRREDLGKVPQPPQEPIDHASVKATATRIRKPRAEAVRRRHDPVEAARVIRMLGLPRTPPKPRKQSERVSTTRLGYPPRCASTLHGRSPRSA